MIELSTLSMQDIIRLQNRLRQELTRRFERRMLLMFSDIVGSTPYFARFGDDVGRQLQQLHLDLLEPAIGAHGGRVVDRAGDGVFCVFESASAALRAVQQFQQATTLENIARPRVHHLRVRIGLHWGTVLSDGELVTGDAVNLAARVSAKADPGRVLLTQPTFLELEPALRLHCRHVGTQTLKGIAEPAELLVFDDRDPDAYPGRLRIAETDQDIELPQQDLVAFGRLVEHEGHPANDVVLHHPDPALLRRISRWHFELRRDGQRTLLRALSNGATLLDGQVVPPGQDVPVRAGSVLRIGDVLTLTLVGRAEEPSQELGGRTVMRLIEPSARTE